MFIGACVAAKGEGHFSWIFIRWRQRAHSTVVQLFQKRLQTKSLCNISESDNFL